MRTRTKIIIVLSVLALIVSLCCIFWQEILGGLIAIWALTHLYIVGGFVIAAIAGFLYLSNG